MRRRVEGIAICSMPPRTCFQTQKLYLVSNSAAASEAVIYSCSFAEFHSDAGMTGSDQKGSLAKVVYGVFFN